MSDQKKSFNYFGLRVTEDSIEMGWGLFFLIGWGLWLLFKLQR